MIANGKFYCIDAHCHVYPEKIASKAVNAIGNFYHIEMCYGGTPEGLLAAGDKVGVDRFVIHSVATKPEQVSSVNNYIAALVAEHPDRFVGMGTMHPLSKDMEKDLKELKSLGLHGVKIHPDMQKYEIDCEGFMNGYELCGEMGLPVLIHTGDYRLDYTNPNRFEKVLKDLPGTKFVGAHFGGYTVWDWALEVLPKYGNLFVDTSSTSFWIGAYGVDKCIKAYGVERCMFGTDYPMHTMEEELRTMLFFNNYSDDELCMIFSENAKRIYNID